MSNDEKMNLRSFVTAYLKRTGAIVEETGYELVETLLPEGIGPDMQDQLLLSFDSEVARENPTALLVTYGSSFLDEMARRATGYGRYTIL
jgi:hypothetical protein